MMNPSSQKETISDLTYNISDELHESPILLNTPHSLSDRYQYEQEIGHGAQGRVFLAKRLSDQTQVVIKQLNIDSVANWKAYDLFRREADVLASLQIPGVAKFYEALECLDDDPPRSFIVQEYIRGSSVAELLRRGHRFQIDDVYDIIIEMLKILQQMHSRVPPVIHRDIKPSNIMLTPQDVGSPKVTLIDFGAVANPQVQGGGSTVAGTFGYMPPEQLTGKPCPASDIYSLGAVAVELFSGKSPADLPTKDFRLIFEPEVEHLPSELVSMLGRMLDPDIERRAQDIAELIARFESFKQHRYQMDALKSKASVRAAKGYHDRLKQVQRINEPGNIQLWQELPDETPREIPNCYQSIVIERSYQTPRQELSDINLGWLESKEDEGFAHSIFHLLIQILIISFVIFYRMLKDLFSGIVSNKVNSSASETRTTMLSKEVLPSCEFDLKNLITMGRKTIATIVKIEYVPARSQDIFKNSHTIENYDLPLFRITYRFNPPDDARSEDLVHQFMTHTEPENHYRVGEPLPIIYRISTCYYGEIVHSMPFPAPLEDACIAELVDNSMPVSSMQKMTEMMDFSQKNMTGLFQMVLSHLNDPDALKMIFGGWELHEDITYRVDYDTKQSVYQLLVSVLLYLLAHDEYTAIHHKCSDLVCVAIDIQSWVDDKDMPNDMFKLICEYIKNPLGANQYKIDMLITISRQLFLSPCQKKRPIDIAFYEVFHSFFTQHKVDLSAYPLLVEKMDVDFIKFVLEDDDLIHIHKPLVSRYISQSINTTHYALFLEEAYDFLLWYLKRHSTSDVLVSTKVLQEYDSIKYIRNLPEFYYKTMHELYALPQTNEQVQAWIKRMINTGQYTPGEWKIT